MLDTLPLANLKQLEKAKIPFISGLAETEFTEQEFGSTGDNCRDKESIKRRLSYTRSETCYQSTIS